MTRPRRANTPASRRALWQALSGPWAPERAGWEDGSLGWPPQPPDTADAAQAYHAGYREGLAVRRDVLAAGMERAG